MSFFKDISRIEDVESDEKKKSEEDHNTKEIIKCRTKSYYVPKDKDGNIAKWYQDLYMDLESVEEKNNCWCVML